MPWFLSTSKVAGQCLARRRIISRQWRRCGYSLNNVELGDLAQIGGVNSISGINSFSSAYKFGGCSSRIGDYRCNSNYKQDSSCIQQRREFLGVGDGKESGMLSKAYEERRVLGYVFAVLFDNLIVLYDFNLTYIDGYFLGISEP